MSGAIGRWLTSFTDGLLGTNYRGSNNFTALNVGRALNTGLNAIPGIAATGQRAAQAGYDAGKSGLPATTALNVGTGIVRAGLTDPVGLAVNGLDFRQTNDGVTPRVSDQPVTPTNPNFDPTAQLPSDAGTTVPVPEYLNADLATAYGMDAATAYQEALSNTSYQRAVRDLQAAGLNPMLAVNGMRGASGVYSAQLAGDGKLSTGVSSAAGAHRYYSIMSNLGTAIGGLVGRGYVGARVGNALGTILGNAMDGQY